MIYKPHSYQQYAIGRMITEPNIGCFLDMGLGKTSITLTAINDLKYNRFAIGKCLIVAPKKVAESTWTAEAKKWDHLKLLRFSLVLGSLNKRIRALAEPADVYVINRENVEWLVNYYANNWPFDMVVADESSSFKNSRSKRFKALKAILPHIERMVLLTGTPAPNGLEDLWAQVYLLDKGQRLGKTISSYRDMYFKHNPYRHEFKALPGAQEAVQDAIKDICVSMRAEDYITLPGCMIADTMVALDDKAAKAYKQLERDMLLEIDETTITANFAAALSNKLLQLCNGAIYTEGAETAPVHECKIEALCEMVEGLNGQHALVFYNFRHDIPRIKAALHGMDKTLRIREMLKPEDAEAWNAGEVDILLAHPASTAYGLNLQEGGHHVIWFGLNWSLELYQQANARLHRQGQKQPVIIHRLMVAGSIDEDVAKALEGKQDTQEAILNALKAKIREVKEAAA